MEWYHVWWPWLTSKHVARFVSDSWVSYLYMLSHRNPSITFCVILHTDAQSVYVHCLIVTVCVCVCMRMCVCVYGWCTHVCVWCSCVVHSVARFLDAEERMVRRLCLTWKWTGRVCDPLTRQLQQTTPWACRLLPSTSVLCVSHSLLSCVQ